MGTLRGQTTGRFLRMQQLLGQGCSVSKSTCACVDACMQASHGQFHPPDHQALMAAETGSQFDVGEPMAITDFELNALINLAHLMKSTAAEPSKKGKGSGSQGRGQANGTAAGQGKEGQADSGQAVLPTFRCRSG